MTDENTDPTKQRKLDRYRRIGATQNIQETLQETLNLPDRTVDVLTRHCRFQLGHSWKRVDGKFTDLTESQAGMWETNPALRDDHFLLRKKSLIARQKMQNRIYWVLSGRYWELIADDWRSDIGESPKHRRAVSLLKTYYYCFQNCDIEAYPTLSSGGQADLLVIPGPPPGDYRPAARDLHPVVADEIEKRETRKAAERHRKEMFPPGERPIAVEVMLDHENTQAVLDRFDRLQEAHSDGLWIFADRRCMNKWLRRLQDPGIDGEEPRIETPYSWSPTTDIDTVQNRIEALELSGMRSVSTIARIENWFDNVEGRKRLLRRAAPLHD